MRLLERVVNKKKIFREICSRQTSFHFTFRFANEIVIFEGRLGFYEQLIRDDALLASEFIARQKFAKHNGKIINTDANIA